MHYRITYFLILILIGITGCEASLYFPTEKDANQSAIPLENLKEGRVLYINNCSNCHNLIEPAQFKKGIWERAMLVMQKKAKINNNEKDLILQYLEAKCKPGQIDSIDVKNIEKSLPLH
jgi:mono/diheme cytochrome c family protein